MTGALNNTSRIMKDLKEEEERDVKLPNIEHDSIYSFFEYIGYDRKKRKIISKEKLEKK